MLEDKMSGIYKITNLFNGSFYIGSSSDIERRFAQHFNDLRKNKHHSILLQRSVNKYGLENFIFEIIDYCNEDELLTLEQFYIDTLQPDYNILKTAGSCLGVKRSDETKKKISEVRKNKGLAKGENNNFYGKHFFGEQNAMYGKKRPDLSERNKLGSKVVLQFKLTGEFVNEFKSLKEASTITNIKKCNISAVCLGRPKHKQAGGYFWKYKEEIL